MILRRVLFEVLLAAIARRIVGQGPSCADGALCPSDQPCCGLYEQCGVGAYCLGGCDPAGSFELASCAPSPICRAGSYSFDSDLSSTISVAEYLGNASAHDWVYNGQPLYRDSTVLLTLAEGNVGTFLSSTFYVWYGKVTARMRTSGGRGIVTDFFLYSDSKDQIDFESVGVELESIQTNIYSQEVHPEATGNVTDLSNTFDNLHEYAIDWTPDRITWTVDAQTVRTLDRSDTWSDSENRFLYPQTPSRVQFNLWPAGLESNNQSTIDWAGGIVDWSSTYMANPNNNPYYYAVISSVVVECYAPPDGANIQGAVSYVYGSRTMTNDTIEITNRDTVLDSFSATGEDPSTNGSTTTSIPPDTPTISVPTQTGDGSTFTQGGNSSSSGSSMSTSTKVGIGVGVPVAVILVALIAFFLFCRRRDRNKTVPPTESSSSNHEKPELPAEYDPAVAGPVIPKRELATRKTVKRKPVGELSANYLPPELHSTSVDAPWDYDGPSLTLPPSLRVEEKGTDKIRTESTSVASDGETSSTYLQTDSSRMNSSDWAGEADALVQELGLVSVRKKTLRTEATTKGISPGNLEGRKGKEWTELCEREERVRNRLDDIDRERHGIREV